MSEFRWKIFIISFDLLVNEFQNQTNGQTDLWQTEIAKKPQRIIPSVHESAAFNAKFHNSQKIWNSKKLYKRNRVNLSPLANSIPKTMVCNFSFFLTSRTKVSDLPRTWQRKKGFSFVRKSFRTFRFSLYSLQFIYLFIPWVWLNVRPCTFRFIRVYERARRKLHTWNPRWWERRSKENNTILAYATQ